MRGLHISSHRGQPNTLLQLAERRTVPGAPSIVPAHSNRLESFLGNADCQSSDTDHGTMPPPTIPGDDDICCGTVKRCLQAIVIQTYHERHEFIAQPAVVSTGCFGVKQRTVS